MSNLTTQYLDKKFGQIDKKFDKVVKGFEAHVDKRSAQLEISLKKEIHKEVSGLAAMTARGFEDSNVRDRVEKLEKKMDKLSEALHL